MIIALWILFFYAIFNVIFVMAMCESMEQFLTHPEKTTKYIKFMLFVFGGVAFTVTWFVVRYGEKCYEALNKGGGKNE